MLYRPVKVRHIYSVEYRLPKPGTPAPKRHPASPDIPATAHGGTFHATGKVVDYWQVYSKLFGECGHKHKTEAAAEPCKRRMKAKWHAYRSVQSKAIQRAIKTRRNEKFVMVLTKAEDTMKKYVQGFEGFRFE